ARWSSTSASWHEVGSDRRSCHHTGTECFGVAHGAGVCVLCGRQGLSFERTGCGAEVMPNGTNTVVKFRRTAFAPQRHLGQPLFQGTEHPAADAFVAREQIRGNGDG